MTSRDARERRLRGSAPGGERRPARSTALPWPELVVGASAAGTYLWRVATPSPWRDEIDTVAIARRSVHDIVALTGHVDLVHLAYYLLSHLVLGLSDTVTALRLISVLAMACASALVVRVGRSLGDLTAGTAAGLLLAVSPLASRYAQEARPFAIATAVATLATWLLVTVQQRQGEGRTASVWWFGYGGTLVLLGLVNVLALLLLVAHVGFVVTRARAMIRRWLITAGAAVVVLSPHLALAFGQREQVKWATRPYLYDLTALYILAFGNKLLPALIGTVTTAVALVFLARARWNASVAIADLPATLVLGVSWAVLPALSLWTMSQVASFWNLRYLVFCLPGLALSVGSLPGALHTVFVRRAGIPRDVAAPRRAVALAMVGIVVLVAAVGLPAQRDYRDPSAGHGEDIRSAVALLDAEARPGDAVLYAPQKLRAIDTMFSRGASDLHDVALQIDPVTAANLAGVEVPPTDLAPRLDRTSRVWLVHSDSVGPSIVTPTDAAKFTLPQLGYLRTAHHQFISLTVDLYQRGTPPH